ncbi:MAG: hypothetical protein J1F05_00695 [Muribaculaceae bacterium]|nr:hypothetical protein [Muribaculaceae bacterium]
MSWATCRYGNPDTEKDDILQRRDWLIENICVEPLQLINKMPHGIGRQYQGEWAIYSCSMLSKSLQNTAYCHNFYSNSPTEEIIDSLIKIVLSPELKLYDIVRWGEDPLESLDSDNSHISYLSHLAWMIGNYKSIVGKSKYDNLYDSICETMNRRILASEDMNLPTYPNEPIYIPDMLVAIVALHDNGNYHNTVNEWLSRAKNKWIDSETGLLKSYLENDAPIKGSYSALNCYLLTLIDEDFAREQYALLKKQFYRGGLFSGIKEYTSRSPIIETDVDAGIILFGLSPSATAFVIGPATFFNDNKTRNAILRTAEIAGHTVKRGHKRHYLLADVALVGESITLAMRTNYNSTKEE